MAKLPTLRSKKFPVSVKISGKPHKIFQIVFHSGIKDSNTYNLITFPYFSKSKGLLSRIAFPAKKINVPRISLLPQGKVTSHLVKYSHPLDGMAHFSGDGKIITTLRNKSKRLDISHGHMFTIQMQNIEAFVFREKDKKSNKNRVDLDFEFKDGIPEALKFTGWWYKATDLKGKRDPKMSPQPHFSFVDSKGNRGRTGFIISPPETSVLSEFVMLLSCQPIPKLDKKKTSVFSFIGGFDDVKDINKEMYFLGCTYPADNYENLLQSIGSVDFKPKNPLNG